METHKTLPQHQCSPYNSTSETSAPCIIQLLSETASVLCVGQIVKKVSKNIKMPLYFPFKGHCCHPVQQQQGWLDVTAF